MVFSLKYLELSKKSSITVNIYALLVLEYLKETFLLAINSEYIQTIKEGKYFKKSLSYVILNQLILIIEVKNDKYYYVNVRNYLIQGISK